MKANFIKSVHEQSNIWTFYFLPNEKIIYTAGQFIELTIPLPSKSADKDRRWFTLSSSPNEELVSITTRIFEKPSDFKNQLKSLRPGDAVSISQAMGDFVLPRDVSINLVFVAGGIGITPYKSIVSWLKDRHERRSISLIHTASSNDDFVFKNLFIDYGCKYNQQLTTKNLLSSKQIIDIASPESMIYISGPEQMVEKLYNELVDAGYPDRLVVGDYFPGYGNI